MKRSEINTYIKDSLAFFEKYCFNLPIWAHWELVKWKEKKDDVTEIINNKLGWDITDFGSNDFISKGLVLFTIRNGRTDDPQGKSYAEKIMVVREEQITPAHFHWYKMEDIINRGGGLLMVQLWNSTDNNQLASTPVNIKIDGIEHSIEAGGLIELHHGESVCIPAQMYHQFWGKKGYGKVLVGEVSKVNDDLLDNYFYESIGRFPEIEEDTLPFRLLCSDYANFVLK